MRLKSIRPSFDFGQKPAKEWKWKKYHGMWVEEVVVGAQCPQKWPPGQVFKNNTKCLCCTLSAHLYPTNRFANSAILFLNFTGETALSGIADREFHISFIRCANSACTQSKKYILIFLKYHTYIEQGRYKLTQTYHCALSELLFLTVQCYSKLSYFFTNWKLIMNSYWQLIASFTGNSVADYTK